MQKANTKTRWRPTPWPSIYLSPETPGSAGFFFRWSLLQLKKLKCKKDQGGKKERQQRDVNGWLIPVFKWEDDDVKLVRANLRGFSTWKCAIGWLAFPTLLIGCIDADMSFGFGIYSFFLSAGKMLPKWHLSPRCKLYYNYNLSWKIFF